MKDHAFRNCTSLQEARLDYMASSSIPISVTELESNAFYAAGRTIYVTTPDGKTSTDNL